MNEKTVRLLKLAEENPDLSIVPMVDYEVVADYGGRWMGSIGCSDVGEYAFYDDTYYEDRDSFKEDYYNWHYDELNEKFNYNPDINEYTHMQGRFTYGEFAENLESEHMLELYLDGLADKYFKRAIIVNIDVPEIR